VKKVSGDFYAEKRFVSRIEVAEHRLLPIIFFLTEQREYQYASVESRIVGSLKQADRLYYELELKYNLQEADIIRTVKNML
jgi:hypothetical protein